MADTPKPPRKLRDTGRVLEAYQAQMREVFAGRPKFLAVPGSGWDGPADNLPRPPIDQPRNHPYRL